MPKYMSQASKMDRYKASKDYLKIKTQQSRLPSIDKARYHQRKGLEGPFMTKSGQVIYYDKKFGKYYNSDTDMYIDHDDWKKMSEEVELDEVSYRGYEIKRQNNKYGHPLIVPALKLTGANMKDIKQLIDRHYLFSIEKEQVDEGTWHIAKDMTKLKNTMKQPMPLGTGSFDFVAKYIGDDELWDDLGALKKDQDMVPAIKKAMKRLGI